MIARIDSKAERALREGMGHVARAEADQITTPLAALNDAERLDALALSMAVACYVVVDACGGEWPDSGDVRQIAGDLATAGTTARQLQLDASEINAYLSGSVLVAQPPEEVIQGPERAVRLAIIVAQRAVVVYGPEELDWWVYLDQVESAIETAWALDPKVLPAAVMRSYLPKPSD